MTAFLDASILIAILAEEADWEHQSDRLDEHSTLLWSPVSRWESVTGLRRRRELQLAEAKEILDDFEQENGVRMVPIGAREANLALDAFARFGKMTSHPAQLNMGDCFAYACAKANHAVLLYKGNDFAKTDLA